MTTQPTTVNNETEPDHVAIRAGAGAGKTTRITRRYINHVLQHGLSPLQIVAVTFTDAAAMELKTRIREKLTEALGPDDDRIAELEAARICTFHSLAAAICRQHPMEAGVPSDFTLLNEIDGVLWAADHLDDAMDALPAELFTRVPFTSMRSILRQLLNDPIATELALAVDREAAQKAIEQLRNSTIESLFADPEFKHAEMFLRVHRGADGDSREIARAAAIALVDALKKGEYDLLAAHIASINLRGGRQPNWPTADLDEVKAQITTIRESIKRKLSILSMQLGDADQAMHEAVADIRLAYSQVQEQLRAAKRRDRVLDFNDLEVHALKALESPMVCKFYHDRWHAFVVDEYQDTNRVQDDILAKLRSPRARLAIVGDANQSIYGFRRADPTLIDIAAAYIVKNNGAEQQLDTNYRTHGNLVSNLNDLFIHMFSEASQRFMPQLSKRAWHGQDDKSWLQIINVSVPKGTLRKVRVQREARKAAQRLLDLVQSGTSIPDRATGQLRPLQWADMAVITRTWDSLDAYEDALIELGIPAVHMGGGSLMDTREARDGATLLRFLADPHDNLALAALLKSPFFSFSDRDLFLLKKRDEEGTLWANLQSTPHHAAAAETLTRWLAFRKSESPSRLVHRADIECGLSAVLHALPRGERRLADWRAFQDLIKDIEKTSFDAFSVARMLRRLEIARADRNTRIEIPRPPLEAGNAVSLMTIHRSKGLEWPVVVMGDLGKTPKNDTSSLYTDPELGVGLKMGPASPAPLHTVLQTFRQSREAAEQRRLLYVAATRARDYLFMVASIEEEKGGATAWHTLLPSITATGLTVENVASGEEAEKATGLRDTLPAATRPQQINATGRIDAIPTRLPATGLSSYRSCPKRFEYQFVLGHPGLGDGDDIYARRGTLVHKAIQLDIKSAAVLQRHDRSLPPEAVEKALELAEVYRSDGYYARYRNAEAVFEEPVTLKLGDITIVGRIDMLGPDFILDFKTGQRKNETEYLLQLWLYGEAKQREELVICYFDGGKPTVRKRSEMQDARETIDAIITGIQNREFAPKPSEATCMHCRYRSLCPDKQP